MQRAGIVLSFDDCFIDQWYEYRMFFRKHEVKATFYLAYINSITTDQWKKMLNLMLDGHEIGFHGVEHLRAGEVSKSLDDPTRKHDIASFNVFVNREIIPGLVIVANMIGRAPKHYSYPYGNRSDESDKILGTIFTTLRRGGRGVYEGRLEKIFAASNYGKREKQVLSGHEPLIELAASKKKLVSLYMHAPIQHRLEYLVERVEKLKLKFYTVEEVSL